MISSASIEMSVDLSTHAAQRLMQQEARERQAEAVLPLGAEENMGAGAGDPARADDLHARPAEADHVMDRVAGFDMAARGIEDDADIAVAFGGIGQKLRRHPLGHLHVDFAEDQDRAGLEQRLGDRRRLRLRLGGVGLFIFVIEAEQGELLTIQGNGGIWAPY